VSAGVVVIVVIVEAEVADAADVSVVASGSGERVLGVSVPGAAVSSVAAGCCGVVGVIVTAGPSVAARTCGCPMICADLVDPSMETVTFPVNGAAT
jgi:transketolase C-terminal domain/subunit